MNANGLYGRSAHRRSKGTRAFALSAALGVSALFGMAIVGAALQPLDAYGVARVGNGGDALAAEFVANADEVLQLVTALIEDGNVTLPAGFNFARFRERIQTAVVYTQDKTMSQGYEVDALNFPAENRIVVSRGRWRSIAFDLKVVRQLIIHEYLGLAGADDRSYQISSFLIRKIHNGGDRGELWLLKDLGDGRHTNPFYGAWLETRLNLFKPSRTPYSLHLQKGRVVSLRNLDRTEPHCEIKVPAFQGSGNPPDSVKVKFDVFSTQEVPGAAGNSVRLDVRKPALVSDFVCTNGEGAVDKATVRDALDALGETFFLNHLGRARLGGQCLPSR